MKSQPNLPLLKAEGGARKIRVLLPSPHVEFIRRVSDFTRIIQGHKKYKLPIICFLDEVERIIPTPEDPREKAEEFNACFEALRVLIQEQRQLSLLVADVHPDSNRINSWTQQGVATNPVFSFFKEVFLPPFSEAETIDMLTNIGKLMGLEFEDQTLRQIHHQSGGHPFVSRQLARFLTQKVREKNGNTLIKWSIVERYLDKTLSQKGELKNYLEKSIWEDLEKRDFNKERVGVRSGRNYKSLSGLDITQQSA